MRKKEEGQSAVELALVLPILMLVVCGIIDFGWMFYNQLSVENGCREGARYACVNSADTNLDTNTTNKVLAMVPNSLRPITVDVTLTDTTQPLDGDVIVEVDAKLKTLTPVLGIIYGANKDIKYRIVMKVES